MDVKFGKIMKNNLFLSSVSEHKEDNIFASNPVTKNIFNNNKTKPSTSSSRLNDFDSNILENNAYLELTDDMLKIEHRMGILEDILSKINDDIENFRGFGDVLQVNELLLRKQAAEDELEKLSKKYSESGLSAKLSGQIASAVNFTSNKKTNIFSKAKKFLSRNVLAKISKTFNYSQDMKEALEKLSNINSNVDDLIKLKVPYGEKRNRYERLTAYLKKANVIHSQISRNFKETK